MKDWYVIFCWPKTQKIKEPTDTAMPKFFCSYLLIYVSKVSRFLLLYT